VSGQLADGEPAIDVKAVLEAKGLTALGVRPAITPETEPFWKAAAHGELLVERCTSCGLHVFPPRGLCRNCRSRTMEWVAVEPPGVLYSVTENHNAWSPDVETSYVVALVEFPEYSGIRFVGIAEGFDGVPEIGTLVDFGFHPALDGLARLHFTPWDAP
jgi:uncharacterized OB-fold protein